MANGNELIDVPPGTPVEQGSTVKQTLERVIQQMLLNQGGRQPTAALPVMSPEDVLRRRQLSTLGVLSGDKPLGQVGAMGIRDIEADAARQENIAAREAVSESSRLQGVLGLLQQGETSAARLAETAEARKSREQSAKDARDLRRQIAAAGSGRPRLTPITAEDGTVYMVDTSTGAVTQPMIGGKPGEPGTPLTKPGRPLPGSMVENLGEMSAEISQMKNLNDVFKNEFGATVGSPLGVLGRAENVLGGAMSTEASNYWGNWQQIANNILKRLSGAAVTQSEAIRFRAANIHPGLTAKEIRRRLPQLINAAAEGEAKLLDAAKKGGYDTKRFEPSEHEPPKKVEALPPGGKPELSPADEELYRTLKLRQKQEQR
jgi:hypothetical protein